MGELIVILTLVQSYIKKTSIKKTHQWSTVTQSVYYSSCDSSAAPSSSKSEKGALEPSLPGELHTCRLYTLDFQSWQYVIVQELCESRGGRPGLSVLTSLLVSVDVKLY